jgi:hypothetical protein
MSSTPENTPPAEPSAGASAGIQHPLVWLLVIVVVAFGLRFWHLNDPLQRDEFGTVYAVAERQTNPDKPLTAADPLVPVSSLDEVRARSVLPFGISNPVPLYNYIVYGTIKVLGITEWSLRLPSLLAGLGCVLGLYWLCRRLISAEMGLVAAALVAVEQIQREVSVMARPYAIGNLACLLSFAALLGMFYARRTWLALLSTLGYGLAVAVIGYMNPVLLLVLVAHVGIVLYWLFGRSHVVAENGGRAPLCILWWVAGCVVAALLLWPESEYMASVHAFAQAHSEYMLRYDPRRLLETFARHNSTFLIVLLVVYVAAYIVRQQMGPKTETAEGTEAGESQPQDVPTPSSQAVTPAQPARAAGGTAVSDSPAEAVTAPDLGSEPAPLDSPDAIWVGRLWFFLPQLVALMLAYAAAEAILVSRYLSYTTLGGMLILAYWATRERSRDVRLAASAAAMLTTFLMGFLGISHGFRLKDDSVGQKLSQDIDNLDSFKSGDVVLLRSSLMEGDFLLDDVPEENRHHVEGAIKALLTTLYVPSKPVRIFVLTKSQRKEWTKNVDGEAVPEVVQTTAGQFFDPGRYYTSALGEELRKSPGQFWIVNDDLSEFGKYLFCFLPWLADQTGYDLTVARNRPKEKKSERYFTVPTDSEPTDFIEGLSVQKPTDFTYLIRVQRSQPRKPRLVTNLRALALAPGSENVAAAVAAAWFLDQKRTPRRTTNPD